MIMMMIKKDVVWKISSVRKLILLMQCVHDLHTTDICITII